MKRFCLCVLSASLLMAACNNNKPKETTFVSSDGKEKVSVDVNQMKNAAEDMQQKTQELQKLTPLTTEELKAMIPETLMGGTKSSYSVNQAMGASVANATYKMNDTTNIKVMMYDCGGPAGAGIYSLQYLGMMNVESENEYESTKTIDFNGTKAFLNCKKQRAECSLTYFAKDRLMVVLEGENVNADGLKQASKELKL